MRSIGISVFVAGTLAGMFGVLLGLGYATNQAQALTDTPAPHDVVWAAPPAGPVLQPLPDCTEPTCPICEQGPTAEQAAEIEQIKQEVGIDPFADTLLSDAPTASDPTVIFSSDSCEQSPAELQPAVEQGGPASESLASGCQILVNGTTPTPEQLERSVPPAILSKLPYLHRLFVNEGIPYESCSCSDTDCDAHRLSADEIGALRQAAEDLDTTASLLERQNLFAQADKLRALAQELRQDAREESTSGPTE